MKGSAHFRRPGEKQPEAAEICALLASILAHGCNLGLHTMEKIAPATAYRKLKHVSDWRLIEENQRGALAGIWFRSWWAKPAKKEGKARAVRSARSNE